MQFRIGNGQVQTVSPLIGCLPLLAGLVLICLISFFMYDTARSAFERLGLSSAAAGFTVFAILLGSPINFPVYRLQKDDLLPETSIGGDGTGLERSYRRIQIDQLIAVNLEGCVIPAALAIFQFVRLAKMEHGAKLFAVIVTAICVFVCWRVAKPVDGRGIRIAWWIPPLTSLLVTWLCLPAAPPGQRAATAFLAGVAGPIIGGDLMYLKEVMSKPGAMISVGGAGTFDGIVLSGIVTALLA